MIFILSVSLFHTSCSGEELNLCDATNVIDADAAINPESEYIAVIGDIQEYTPTDEMAQYLYKTCDWLRSMQYHYGNIVAVLQNGDLTWNNSCDPWIRADHSLVHLGGALLFIPVTGNHDYTWGGKNKIQIEDRRSTRLNTMPNLASLREENIESFEEGRLENIIVPLKGGMKGWYVIALEFGPRPEAVAWADSIVRSNPDRKYILMTHEWMWRNGERIDKGSAAEEQFVDISYTTPREIWERLVYPNDNIYCVLCGHNGFCKYLFSPNKTEREVCQILFNLQYQENGGNGMIQLWEFPKDKKEINIFVYNTITRKIHEDTSTRISIPL